MSQKLSLRKNDGRLRTHYFNIRTLLFSERYRTEVNLVDPSVYDRISDCNKSMNFVMIGCPKGHVRKVRPASSCDSHFCLKCAGRKGRKNGVKIFERLMSVPRNRGFMQFIFTVPSHLWPFFILKENMARWKKVCRRILREFYRGTVGCVEREHTWGDKEVKNLLRDEPHLNYLLPAIIFDHEKKPVFVSLHRSKAELKSWRKIYLKNMRKEFGLSKEKLRKINFHYSYSSKGGVRGKSQLLHKTNYMARPPLEIPFRKEVKILEFYGEKKTSDISKAVIRHFEYYKNYRSTRWVGWISPCVYPRYLKILGLSDDEVLVLQESLKHEKNCCPVCGVKYVIFGIYLKNKLAVVYEDPPPIASLIRNEDGSIFVLKIDDSIVLRDPVIGVYEDNLRMDRRLMRRRNRESFID